MKQILYHKNRFFCNKHSPSKGHKGKVSILLTFYILDYHALTQHPVKKTQQTRNLTLPSVLANLHIKVTLCVYFDIPRVSHRVLPSYELSEGAGTAIRPIRSVPLSTHLSLEGTWPTARHRSTAPDSVRRCQLRSIFV